MLTRTLFPLAASAFLTACGTTYDLPAIDAEALARADAVLAAEAQADTPLVSTRRAVDNYARVVRRVEPVAEQFCRDQTRDRPDIDCDIQVFVDADDTSDANAFQSYDNAGNAIVVFNLAFLSEARNRHEIAFVLGHEMGHHLANHIGKIEQQALAGALLLGAAAAYAAGSDPYLDAGDRQDLIGDSMDLGSAIGQMAYSQTYELEADFIATHITRMAGYDPIVGARLFARRKSPTTPDGELSFWGTHPSSNKRLALVELTNAQINGTDN